MAIVLLVAIFSVHLPYGFSSIKLLAVTPAGAHFGPPGYETDLLYLACLAALVLGGSGPRRARMIPARINSSCSSCRPGRRPRSLWCRRCPRAAAAHCPARSAHAMIDGGGTT
ncbi:MAG TPA: hypothetical protein VGN43_18100 [Steroidobacteraceae bacterium]|nr:hypothetical protein [Steroidobacteraceae bacterium]